MDDTNALTEAEAKYFDTGGQAGLPLAETPPEAVEKPVEKPEPEAKPAAEDKAPPQIEVVDENEIDADEPDARKYVKVGVVRKEREEKKQLRARAEQAEAARALLEGRIRSLEQATPQREPEPLEVVQRTANELAQIKQQLGENAAKQQFISSYQQKAQEFITGSDDEPGVPDFPDAYKHALGMRRMIYETAGYNQAQVNQLLESEEAAIVERAMLDHVNPAKRIYDIAKGLGYAPKAAIKADPVNEQTQRQADTADKTLEAAKKLEKIAKGMDKNKSLAGAGGGNDQPTLEELAMMAMDPLRESEFEKHTAGTKFKAVMGG